jgi:hypothetical protein
MTFRVPIIPGKRTFLQLKEPGNASDFTLTKGTSVFCCGCDPCSKIVDPTYLYVNLIKKMDLNGVDVVQSVYPLSSPVAPTTINPSVPFYLNYSIDPKGALFGNSPCGINNYPNFMVYKS